jgi:hypothetical protein
LYTTHTALGKRRESRSRFYRAGRLRFLTTVSTTRGDEAPKDRVNASLLASPDKLDDTTYVSPAIYAFDPDAAPDADFLCGDLRHLVIGNRGRLLDARRTPIAITAVVAEKGAFEVEIGAFEDAGARWELPLQDVSRFQFARDGAVAAPDAVTELERAAARFERLLAIECDPDVRRETLRRIAEERRAVRERLASAGSHAVDVARHIATRQGNHRLFGLLDHVLAARGLAELDHDFSATLVSNPGSGEIVKGHAIVLAELGLCPYRGKIVRDPDLFMGPWSRQRRAEHLIARLAFTQELWSCWGHDKVTLHRGATVDGPLPAVEPSSFVAATFSWEVAAAHFEGGPATQTAVVWRQAVPITRLVMTFLETRELNRRFHEAEAVLIGDPTNLAF